MIAIECACGRKLKVKDEHAGKRIRCPECSEPVKVPVPEPEESFLDDLDDLEDESDEELPKPRPTSKKSTKKRPAKQSRRNSGSGITAKQVLGGVIMTLGCAFLVAIVMFIFSGQFVPKRIGGLILPFAMIGMGWAWVKGETYGS